MSTIELPRAVSPLKRIELRGLFGERDLRVEMATGPITLLFAQNGAGKSTTLRVVEQMVGHPFHRLPQEPIQGAVIEFLDGARIEYVAGTPPRWMESFPQLSTGAFGMFPEAPDVLEDPAFAEFVNAETPYVWREGQVLAAGAPVPPSMIEFLRTRFERATKGRQRAAPISDDGRRTKRDCFLLTSDRLVEARLAGRGLSPRADRVCDIAGDITELILQTRQESARKSWKLDGSFIGRAAATLGTTKPMATAEREALIARIEQLQGRMARCALASGSAHIPEFPTDSPEVMVILDLYLHDMLQKCELSFDALRKLELFAELINSHLTDKQIVLSTEHGLFIEGRRKNAGIPLECLSSGERHLIVLFYHLIFVTSPGGLFLIDEPEISLHVDWQERFIDSVARIAEVSPQQYLIATHSPSIVGRHYELLRDLSEEQSREG